MCINWPRISLDYWYFCDDVPFSAFIFKYCGIFNRFCKYDFFINIVRCTAYVKTYAHIIHYNMKLRFLRSQIFCNSLLKCCLFLYVVRVAVTIVTLLLELLHVSPWPFVESHKCYNTNLRFYPGYISPISPVTSH